MKTKNMIGAGIALMGSLASYAWSGDGVRIDARLDHSLLRANAPTTAFLKVGLNPGSVRIEEERPAVSLAIVIDRSGSMSGEKIETAKQAVIQAIGRLRDGDRVALISYSQDARIEIPLERVGDVENAIYRISNIRSGGNTAIYSAVNLAASQLRREEDRNAFRRILLLSDGLANVGPSDPVDFSRLGRALMREGISVSTVGLGMDYNEDLMAGLSMASEGNTYFAENYRDLPRIFDSEMRDTTTVIARNVRVRIECEEGFAPKRFLGREGTIKGNAAVFEIPQLFAEQEKYGLLELEVAAHREADSAPVAKVLVEYWSQEREEEVAGSDVARVGFVVDEEKAAASVDMDVQRGVVANRIAAVKEEAIALADAGQVEQATVRIQSLNHELATANEAWNDADVAAQNASLYDRWEQLNEEGMTKKSRKEMRSSSYQSARQLKSGK